MGGKLALPSSTASYCAELKITEERKHAILFAATILCAREIIDIIDAADHQKMGEVQWLGVL